MEVNTGSGWFEIAPTVGYSGDDVDCEGGTGCDETSCRMSDQSYTGFNCSDGNNNTWRSLDFNIAAYSSSTNFQIRFLYGSHDGYGCSSCDDEDGWYIDNIRIAYEMGCTE